MSCVGVMYQPYSTSSYLTASTPAPPPPAPPPTSTSPTSVPGYPDHLAPLPLKREISEKMKYFQQYKLERELGGHDISRLSLPHLEAPGYSSPRGQNGSSAGSCGTPDPRTPLTPRPASQQERESDGEEELQRTAQYLARNVILYTHYVGEVSRIVDEHFSKALDQTTYSENKVTPMASRNLPPSFFNAHYHAQVKSSSSYASPGDLYSETAGYPGLHHLAAHHASSSPDPWQYAAQATASSPYHRSVQDLAAYTSPAAASRLQSQYSSLFLNNPAATSRLQAAAATVKSELPWPTSGPGSSDYHSPGDFSHHLDRNYSPHPYANMTPSGLEAAAAQDSAKDLYWPSF